MRVAKLEDTQLSLNSDHTHFIIIRKQPINSTNENQLEKYADSAESVTNQFRDRFDRFLHKENFQEPVIASAKFQRTTTGIHEICMETFFIDSF